MQLWNAEATTHYSIGVYAEERFSAEIDRV